MYLLDDIGKGQKGGDHMKTITVRATTRVRRSGNSIIATTRVSNGHSTKVATKRIRVKK